MHKIIASIALLFALSISGWAQGNSGWMNGNWQGTGRQMDDGSTWRMMLFAGGGKYQVRYPTLKCGGEWTLVSLTSRSAKFRERIKYGASNCEPRGTVVINKLRGGRIEFKYFYPGAKKVGAYAILYKRRG